MRVTRSGMEDVRQPVLAIANHISNMDFLIAGVALRPLYMHFVTAAYQFRNPYIRWLLRLLGCISKEQFFSDYRSIRQMLQVRDRGEGIVIYPAGQSSFSGEATYVGFGIAPLVKKLGMPVVNVHTQGAHMGFPKWNMSGLRKTRIEVHVSPLLSESDVRQMSETEIYQKIVDALYFDDYEWQRSAMIAAKKPRCAEGLQKFLFRCPRCKTEFTMHTKKNRLYCGSCGNAARMDEYGLLRAEDEESVVFDTPSKWDRWQIDEYRPLLAQADFVYAEPCELYKLGRGGRYYKVGQGAIELNLACFRFTGQSEGESVTWTVDNRVSAIFPHEQETGFLVMIRDTLYLFKLRDEQRVFKLVLLKELIFKMYYEVNSGKGIAQKERNISKWTKPDQLEAMK